MCSRIVCTPRRVCAICTAVAPERVFTFRTNNPTDAVYSPPLVRNPPTPNLAKSRQNGPPRPKNQSSGTSQVAEGARLDFFSKQVRTSRNIRGGWWATILMGGLNYQVEHHLFPSMARPHLSKVRVVVREFCETHDVPYTETSLWRSYAIVIDYLNRVGLAARDPFDCPMVGQYRRA